METDKKHSDIKYATIIGLIWTYAERLASQIVSFVLSVVLARLLAPQDFGLLALVLVIINFFDSIISFGFGTSLVQKKDADQIDFSVIFWTGIGVQSAIVCLLWICAPYVSDFYSCAELTWLFRFLSFRLIFLAISSVQHAFVQKRMEFRKLFFSTLWGRMISMLVAIAMAFQGFGVWALAVQYMTSSLIDILAMFWMTRWRPSLCFSLERLSPLLSFGSYMMISGVISGFSEQLRSLIIGKQFSPSDLAYFDRGNSFPNLLNANINGVFSTVLFPAFANMNEDLSKLKQTMRNAMRVSVFLLAPIMVCLGVVAEPLVKTMLTEKWLGAVPFIQIMSIHWLMNTPRSISSQMIKAIGRSDMYFFSGLIQSGTHICLLLFAALKFHSVYSIAMASVVSIFVGNLCLALLNSRYVDYAFCEQVADLAVPLGLSALMGTGIYLVGMFSPFDIVPSLIVQCILGLSIYLLLGFVTRNRTLLYIISLVKNTIFTRRIAR